jgi:UDP-2,3-diacylglucosamine hydrolase
MSPPRRSLHPSNTLFISDLHLCTERPAITELFLSFLEQQAAFSAALYILGDLFEIWLGDDDTGADNQRIVSGLRGLADRGVPVYLIHGNRDFLMGEAFSANSGCRLLSDPSVIDLYGKPTVIMHGDSLCTEDTVYQIRRSELRSNAWKKWFLSLSFAERKDLGQQYRMESREKTAAKSDIITDVHAPSVAQLMREHHVTQLIHGHTHRPAIHDFRLDGQAAQRIVLGAWYTQGSVLDCNENGCRLTTLPL